MHARTQHEQRLEAIFFGVFNADDAPPFLANAHQFCFCRCSANFMFLFASFSSNVELRKSGTLSLSLLTKKRVFGFVAPSVLALPKKHLQRGIPSSSTFF